MYTPRLIATDLDGTLVDPTDQVTRRTYNALYRAHKAGVKVVLATGRPPRGVELVVSQLPFRPMCLCSNGAVAYDSSRQEILWSRTLKPELLRAVYRVAMEQLADFGGVAIAAERVKGGERFLVDPQFADLWSWGFSECVSVEEVMSASAVKMLMVNLSLSAAFMAERVQSLVDPEMAAITYSVEQGLLEVSAPHTSKATALQWLTEWLGLSREDAVAFGDMSNDLEMLSWAGWGVAMGNAEQRVQDIADEVTSSNSEDGVAKVLERWFPGL